MIKNKLSIINYLTILTPAVISSLTVCSLKSTISLESIAKYFN